MSFKALLATKLDDKIETTLMDMDEGDLMPGDWLVKIPEPLTTKDAMAIGTAGYTAMLSLLALEHGGITPDRGDILVTGANGGVGSIAIALLCLLSAIESLGPPEDLTKLGIFETSVWQRSSTAARFRNRVRRLPTNVGPAPLTPLAAIRWSTFSRRQNIVAWLQPAGWRKESILPARSCLSSCAMSRLPASTPSMRRNSFA